LENETASGGEYIITASISVIFGVLGIHHFRLGHYLEVGYQLVIGHIG
jgi:hypothetical protein